jgi:hypothetical protein
MSRIFVEQFQRAHERYYCQKIVEKTREYQKRNSDLQKRILELERENEQEKHHPNTQNMEMTSLFSPSRSMARDGADEADDGFATPRPSHSKTVSEGSRSYRR